MMMLKLQKDLVNNETNAMNKKHIEWENIKDEKIMFNKTFCTQRTFVGLAVKNYEDYLSMKKDDEYIVFTDRSCVHYMHPIKNTQ